jgi:hypothetical protein
MQFVRTPDDRFNNLPDWPYSPIYPEVSAGDRSGVSLRVHHIDEGPRDADDLPTGEIPDPRNQKNSDHFWSHRPKASSNFVPDIYR